MKEMNKADRNLQPNSIVPQLVFQSTQANRDQLAQIVEAAATAPFATDLLEVNEPLWGSFWHGDVMAPGYRLPAIELALLRATRLDQNWPEETETAQFLADLQQAICQPQTGIWTILIANEPCVVFGGQVSEAENLATVVWYCATTGRLHAGYRLPSNLHYLEKASEQRKPEFKYNPVKTKLP